MTNKEKEQISEDGTQYPENPGRKGVQTIVTINQQMALLNPDLTDS